MFYKVLKNYEWCIRLNGCYSGLYTGAGIKRPTRILQYTTSLHTTLPPASHNEIGPFNWERENLTLKSEKFSFQSENSYLESKKFSSESENLSLKSEICPWRAKNRTWRVNICP
jgi:hypothetical protein